MKSQTKLLGLCTSFLIGVLLIIAVFASISVPEVVAESSSPDANPRFRIAHLAPTGSGTNLTVTVAIYNSINQVVYTKDYNYLDSIDYDASLAQGNYTIQVFPPGNANSLAEKAISMSDDTDYTAVIVGGNSNQEMAILFNTDNNTAPGASKGKIRLGHLAPFADTITDTKVDVRYQTGEVIKTDVTFGDIASTYLEVDAGSLDFKVTEPGGEMTLIDPAPITVSNGDIQDIYAIGDVDNQPLGVFGWPNDDTGASLPLSTKGNLQLVHLSPLTDPTDPLFNTTAVTITIDNVNAVTDFEYGESTAYEEYDAGNHVVQVTVAGEPSYSISQTIKINAGMDYTLYLVGGNDDRVLELVYVTNNNAAPSSGNGKIKFANVSPFILDSRVDIRKQDDTLIVGNLLFKRFTDYMEFPAGATDFKITTVGGGVTLVDPAPFTLSDGDIATFLASGDDRTQPTSAFYVPDGEVGNFLSTNEPGNPGIAISKSPDTQNIETGGTADFVITVRNTGNISLTNVTVTDALAPDCDKNLGTLTAGTRKTYTCEKTNVTASFLNEAIVTAQPVDSAQISAKDTASVVVFSNEVVGLTIDKLPEVQSVSLGATATFTIIVKNTGTVALSNVSVADSEAPNCNKTLGTMAPGQQQTYVCTKASVMKSFLNEAVATGKPASSDAVTAKDRAAVNVTSHSVYLPSMIKE